jgi:hypothetical protein
MNQALTFNRQEKTVSGKKEFSRILSAAVINSHFRKMLLNDPLKAISNGYSGEQFDINREEKVRLSTIRATSLADFATQLSKV